MPAFIGGPHGPNISLLSRTARGAGIACAGAYTIAGMACAHELRHGTPPAPSPYNYSAMTIVVADRHSGPRTIWNTHSLSGR